MCNLLVTLISFDNSTEKFLFHYELFCFGKDRNKNKILTYLHIYLLLTVVNRYLECIKILLVYFIAKTIVNKISTLWSRAAVTMLQGDLIHTTIRNSNNVADGFKTHYLR